MSTSASLVLCNGASEDQVVEHLENSKLLTLSYQDIENVRRNINISLPNFVKSVGYLPDRMLDLIELAVYVFLADRSISRGSRDAIEHHSWARSMRIAIKVRDYEFWSQESTQEKLSTALKFMSADRSYQFYFQPGHTTPPMNLFDRAEFAVKPAANLHTMLFSGGLDSLAGAIERLETTNDHVCLVSHRSQPGVKKTQNQLLDALKNSYPDRISHYKFECSLSGVAPREETQRTRSFLYTAIAATLAYAISEPRQISVYENGITSFNFPKREDMSNARSSRTTHPRTIALLQKLYCEVLGEPIEISTPYMWKTKTDIFDLLRQFSKEALIPSAISCGNTRSNLGISNHCGGCSQCVDRRLGAYGAKVHDIDDGSAYKLDFIYDRLEGQSKTTVVDYIRQAQRFADWNVDHFYEQRLSDLSLLTDCVGESTETAAVEHIWALCKRHGDQVIDALKTIRSVHDNPAHEVPEDSLLQLINNREYLRQPVVRLASDICEQLRTSIPKTFQRQPPANENDLNDKISGLLEANAIRFNREHPTVTFALAKAVPDHSTDKSDVFIETKYLRKSTTPSRASEDIAADLTKYPAESYKLFVVYDPQRSISDDSEYSRDIEKHGKCMVCVVR